MNAKRKLLFVTLILLLTAALLAGCRDERPSPTHTADQPSAPPDAPTLAITDPTPAPPDAPTVAVTPTDDSFDLYLPVTGSQLTPTPTAEPTPTPPPPTAEPTPAFPRYAGAPLNPDLIGIQIYLSQDMLNDAMHHAVMVNVGWVKTQVSWKLFEPEPGNYDENLLYELDLLVTAARGAGVKLMLGLAKAPDWARTTVEEDGPPTDPADFEAFAYYIANRYEGSVAAYELWNETNLQREWLGGTMDGADVVRFIAAGAAGVRAGDPAALVISGAPAPTGINDGVTAVQDRLYLRQMAAAGVGDHVDAIGAHPYGWGNPPDTTVANPDLSIPSHNDHPTFFFADTLADYRTILDEAGLAHLPIWVTEFGWGSFENFGAGPPPDAVFMTAVNEWQQAEYALRAFEMGQELAWMGPMILWNLNFAPLLGPEFSKSGYGLLRPDGSLRPIYYSLADALNGR